VLDPTIGIKTNVKNLFPSGQLFRKYIIASCTIVNILSTHLNILLE